jgi:hypothetical protein
MRYYSNSEFQTFKDCRRKWWLGWYRNLKPFSSDKASAAGLGTLVHLALAPLYVPEGEEPKDPRQTLETLIYETRVRVVEVYQENPQDADDILRELDRQGDLARAMIDGYMQWLEETGADSDYEVLGSEQVVKHEVTPGRTLIGRLDARVRRLSDGVRLFLDHKTCASFQDLARSLMSNEQMPTYLILERAAGAADGDYVEGAVFNGLRKVKRTGNAKPPFFERMSRTYNHHELESLWLRIQGTMADIDRTAEMLDNGANPLLVAYPTPSRDCHWKCEFYSVCPMFDDGSRAEDMLETFFVIGDPLSRYPELNGEIDYDSNDV